MRNNTAAFRFAPFSVQQKKLMTWWLSPSPYRDYDMVIADGSIRSGKTIAMIDGFVTWGQATFRDENFILAGKSMGALKRNVIKPMLRMLTAKGIPYHYVRSADEPRIEIGSNVYYLFGANNEASQDVLQGLTAAGALLDEAALFPESFVEQAIARCSVEGSKVWMNCNPEGPFHFIKTEYIDKAEEKKALHLHFTLDDNLTLSEKIKERYKRLFTGLWYKRMILGLWVMAEGVIYDMFDEAKNCLDVLPQERFDYYLVGVDYGTGNPTVFGLYGVKGREVIRINEYYYSSRAEMRQKTDAEYSKDLKQFLNGIVPRAIYCDPSAASFITQLRKDGFWQVRSAKNDVVDGIRTVGNMLAEGRFKILRPKCPKCLKDFAAYLWDPKAQKHGEDKPLKENDTDHTMDEIRYVLHSHFSGQAFQAGAKPRGY